MTIEICTPSKTSALHAAKAGADRIELCANLAIGGTTPSSDDIDYCTRQLGIRTHVLIRPRGGNFVYSPEEVAQIFHDIEQCKKLGASAVVIGFLNEDGSVNKQLTQRAVSLAAPMEVTFHRAFDECADWQSQLETIIACGCHRILTSGHCPNALEGKENLRAMVSQAAGRITILAGCGITPDNVREIITASGVSEVHGSCKKIQDDGTIETDPLIVSQLIRNANFSPLK